MKTDDEEVVDQVRVDVLGSPAHVILLKATASFANGGFNLPLSFHINAFHHTIHRATLHLRVVLSQFHFLNLSRRKRRERQELFSLFSPFPSVRFKLKHYLALAFDGPGHRIVKGVVDFRTSSL